MRNVTYDERHLSILKEYCVIKLMFTFLISLVMMLQSAIWLIVWYKEKTILTSDVIAVTITLIGCLAMIISQMIYYRHNTNIVNEIEQKGSSEVRDLNFRFNSKSGLAWGLLALFRILAFLLSILTGILIVQFIRDYVNWGEAILKMPIVILMLIAFMNTSASLRLRSAIDKINLGK